MITRDANNHEILDDTPVAMPMRFRRQSFVDQMREFVRQELSRQAEQQNHETFEEADDFYIEDDDLPRTRYELDDEMISYHEPAAEPESPAPASQTPPQTDSESGSDGG